MKEFAPYIIALVIGGIALACALTGCKTAPGQSNVAARVAVTYATAKYIEKADPGEEQARRAQRIVAVLDQIEGLAGGDSSVTVDLLRAYVAQRLPADLSQADRLLAGTLIDVATQELRARIGEGVLSETSLLKVREVLQWVREGATSYLPAGS